MEAVLIWTIAIVYGAWLLLTVIRSLVPQVLVRWRLPRFIWGLLPNWNLFAPKPGMADYYVLYRDRQGTEEPGPWQLAFGPEARKWSHGLWNPNKNQAKAVFDLVQQLARHIMEMKPGGEEALMKSAPYLHLLHFVRNLPRKEAQEQTQFTIVVREPANQYEANLITSPFYWL